MTLSRLWEEEYSRQKPIAHYIEEDQREDPLLFLNGISLFQHLQNEDSQKLIETLMRYKRGRLDPPEDLYLSALREWLSTAVIKNLQQGQPYEGLEPSIIVLDERRDPTDTTSTTRHWDSETYLRYPPTGLDVNTEKLDLPGMTARLSRKVLQPDFVSCPSQYLADDRSANRTWRGETDTVSTITGRLGSNH
jgi:hypothetical protein